MPSEGVLKKAVDYLAAGKVTAVFVKSDYAGFKVQGNEKDPYEVEYANGEWVCNCPARVIECSHLVAVRLVCKLQTTDEKPRFASNDPEIDALLA